ncbi:hypothetical protein Pmani_010794 [Petrolisthes manimaculis]|uniref:Uncharacterized protein n=1 Tax=Petrolisthes manimaculis TaxID=1843537 RepID=A0AAE1UGX6_9EUCA|nr:hypothetical protein Pmani_010794 [Petrolisthes manimaculis]
MAVSTKWPPKLSNEAAYELWRKDIEIWCKLSDLSKKQQALAIHLSLDGRARISTSELEVDALESDDGVKTILEKLDGLFLVDKGYTGTGGKEKESKIQRLVKEAKGCAVLDSGCSTTVCGADWYGSFIQNLSDVERDSIFVEESTSSFTFGDGVTVSSVMRVTLPCVINESGSDSRRDENDHGGAASVDDQTLPSRYTFEESEDGDVHGNATEIQVGEVSEPTTEVESAPEIAPALPSRIVAGTRIQGTRSDTGELVSGRVMSRAGKASGRYSDCYNFRLCQIFRMGGSESKAFKYVGLNIVSYGDGSVTLDQNQYAATLTPISVSKQKATVKSCELSESERSEYRAVLGQLNWIATHTRPDIAFEVCELSGACSKATIADLLRLNKVIDRVKNDACAGCDVTPLVVAARQRD